MFVGKIDFGIRINGNIESKRIGLTYSSFAGMKVEAVNTYLQRKKRDFTVFVQNHYKYISIKSKLVIKIDLSSF